MHKSEFQEAFAKLHASKELEKEVLLMEEKKTCFFTRMNIRRVAVCAAVLIVLLTTMLMPGRNIDAVSEQNILKVYACDIGDTENMKFEENALLNGVETSPWHCICDPFMSANTYLPFTLSFPADYFPGEEITFDIYADFAKLWRYTQDDNAIMPSIGAEYFDKFATIQNNSTILWECDDADQLEQAVGDKGVFYIRIVIRADGQIVGYGLIGLQLSTEPVRTVTVIQCETVSFKTVDGKKQSVSEDYVWKQIEKLK